MKAYELPHSVEIRDWFAGLAMQAELNSSGDDDKAAVALARAAVKAGQSIEERIAFNAYAVADAMMRLRAKGAGIGMKDEGKKGVRAADGIPLFSWQEWHMKEEATMPDNYDVDVTSLIGQHARDALITGIRRRGWQCEFVCDPDTMTNLITARRKGGAK